MGPLPTAKGNKKFVIVAVDYFTKWAEAEALARIGQSDVKGVVWKNVVCRFGIPQVLITDNGTQFDESLFRNFCAELGIRQHFSSPGHPQANGQAEVTNRSILEALKKRMVGAKGNWLDELTDILWSYRTSVRAPTGESPFTSL